MNRSNPTEDFSQIKKQLQELDQQITVPFAATAEGMKDRLSSLDSAKLHASHRWAWSAASLLVVAAIGCALWFPRSPFMTSAKNASAADSTEMAAEPEMTVANDALTYGSGAFSQKEAAASAAAVSSSLRATSDSNVSEGFAAKMAYYPAESYSQVQLALSEIPSSENGKSLAFEDGETDFLPGADSSVSMADQTYQYTLTCTPEGIARLDIRSTSDGTLLSRTDVNCVRGTLFAQEQTLILAGECEEGTKLQFFDISDPSSPALKRTLIQEGNYLGAWRAEDALLIGSLYQVTDTSDCIPGIYDSSNDQKRLLEAEQILLSDNCSSASFAVVTAVPIASDTAYASFAVLGASNVSFSSGELTVSTVGNDSDLSIRQEQIWRTN